VLAGIPSARRAAAVQSMVAIRSEQVSSRDPLARALKIAEAFAEQVRSPARRDALSAATRRRVQGTSMTTSFDAAPAPV
jgi:hypothetical protein